MSLAVHPESRPTNIRYVVLALTTMVAVLLYVDRICLSMVASTVKIDLSLSDDDMSYVLGSFFLTYAFAQVPAGWLSDRYGGRFMLGLYLAGWSLFTGFLGFAYSWAALIALRLGCGLFEAGAYPAAVGIVGALVSVRAARRGQRRRVGGRPAGRRSGTDSDGGPRGTARWLAACHGGLWRGGRAGGLRLLGLFSQPSAQASGLQCGRDCPYRRG